MIKKKYDAGIILRGMSMILPAVMLAGCGEGPYDKSTLEHGIQAVGNWELNAAFSLNQFVGSCVDAVRRAAFGGNGQAGVVEQAVNLTKTAYGSFADMVMIFQWIAIAFIAVKFGQRIFNTYYRENTRFAGSAMSLLKKIMVALLLTWGTPYLIFTAYYGATASAMAVANQIHTSRADAKETPYQIYTYMSRLGIQAASYCTYKPGQVNPPSSKGFGQVVFNPAFTEEEAPAIKNQHAEIENRARIMLWKDDFLEEAAAQQHVSVDTVKNSTAARVTELNREWQYVWDQTCGYDRKGENYEEQYKDAAEKGIWRIYDGFTANPEAQAALFVNRDAVGGTVDGLAKLCIALNGVLFALGAVVSVIRRLLDAMMLVVTAWWYIGNYVTDDRGESIRSFLAKLWSMALTQFVVLVEVALYMEIGQDGSSGNPIFTIAQGMAWLLLLLATPTAIDGMANDTGARAAGFTVGGFMASRIGRK